VRLLLDTNAYTALRLGRDVVAEQVQRSEQVLLSVVVAGELLFGFRHGSRYDENAGALREFLGDPNVTVLPIAWTTAEIFGRLSATLRKRGTPIPTNDIWLAAQAMEADATLLSSDRHFGRVDGLSWLAFPAG
jgi:tRNA(fMet)-specific endonuclease VapC